MNDLYSLARKLGIHPGHVLPLGRDKAKVALAALANRPTHGRLILVSGITPTIAGEGKTTLSIGLAQGVAKLGRSAALALRQPSMGPVFGRKGGATGGGRSCLAPADSINLHFTGDFHAVTSANNLLSSLVDNHLHFKTTRLSASEVGWKRVLDVNDRALRTIATSRGSTDERETGFNITAASEIMAILCLSESMDDLRARLDRVVVGFTEGGDPVFACEFGATGALLALLRDALPPNLVQSVEGVPAFVHGGPFANIAHGCNSVLATRMALAFADYAITEAGFAFDLGGEKFIDIKCRQSGLAPDLVVLVSTVRALKMHGGVSATDLERADPAAVERGIENLAAHLAGVRQFGQSAVVAVNRFSSDTPAELEVVHGCCRAQGVPCATADPFHGGGDGCIKLAETVIASLPPVTPPLAFLYANEEPLERKLHAIATRLYGADGVILTEEANRRSALFERAGFHRLPVCMAKTHQSLTDDPDVKGRPRGFTIGVRDFEIANGAGFVVALTGQIMRMPALPRRPAAERIDVTPDGVITGI